MANLCKRCGGLGKLANRKTGQLHNCPKCKGTGKSNTAKNPAGVPIGKWIKANKVRMNRNGTVTVSVPSRRPATKRKRR